MKRRRNRSAGASAFQIALSLGLISVSAVLLAAASFTASPTGAGGTGPTSSTEQLDAIPAYPLPKVIPGSYDGDVRDLPHVPQRYIDRPELEEPFNAQQLLSEAQVEHPPEPNIPLAPMPTPIQNFPGMSRNDICTGGTCGGGIPPDTNGDVGPNHYIQAVNSAYAIYNKTGTLLASFTENSLFSGSGTACVGIGGGDPVVIYDPLADRWILTHLGFTSPSTGPFYQCIAASKTSNPVTGGWWLYAVRTDTGGTGQPPVNTLNDYPKFGIWTDCLYYSANGFLNGASFNGGEFASFSRSDMYAGLPLTAQLGFATTSDYTMISSNLSAPGAALAAWITS